VIQTLFGSLDQKEEEKKSGLFDRMKSAVARTRESLSERIDDIVSFGKEMTAPRSTIWKPRSSLPTSAPPPPTKSLKNFARKPIADRSPTSPNSSACYSRSCSPSSPPPSVRPRR